MMLRLIFGYNSDKYGRYTFIGKKKALKFQLYKLFFYTSKLFTENNIPTHIYDISLQ